MRLGKRHDRREGFHPVTLPTPVPPTRAVIDACVLFPVVPRVLTLAAARAGHLVPLWSDRILEEWRRAVLAKRPEEAGAVATEIAALRAAFVSAEVAPDPDLEASLSLPDPDDRHVLATAIAGGAHEIVTFNLSDFPGRTLARHGIILRHPDEFLTEIAAGDPEYAQTVVDTCTEMSDAAPRSTLKRAKLPRLAKAIAAGG